MLLINRLLNTLIGGWANLEIEGEYPLADLVTVLRQQVHTAATNPDDKIRIKYVEHEFIIMDSRLYGGELYGMKLERCYLHDVMLTHCRVSDSLITNGRLADSDIIHCEVLNCVGPLSGREREELRTMYELYRNLTAQVSNVDRMFNTSYYDALPTASYTENLELSDLGMIMYNNYMYCDSVPIYLGHHANNMLIDCMIDFHPMTSKQAHDRGIHLPRELLLKEGHY